VKLYTPDGSELLTVTSLEASNQGLVISGTIMGAMPMKGVLRGAELRAIWKFMTWSVIRKVCGMLLGGK
jgi:hypothetical protein